jgi:large subunit ribosomal protein L23
MKSSSFLIKKPWLSEKATSFSGLGKYVFLVDRQATSYEIKRAIESIYKVQVVKVNILNRVRQGKHMKKAIVTLRSGQKIDIVPH